MTDRGAGLGPNGTGTTAGTTRQFILRAPEQLLCVCVGACVTRSDFHFERITLEAMCTTVLHGAGGGSGE